MKRREFLLTQTTLAGLAFGNIPSPWSNLLADHSTSKTMIGIQIGAPSFVDEGIEETLDTLQELACVNTLFAMVYSYKEGLSGRAWPPVDHGSQQKHNFHGGYYAKVNPAFFQGTIFENQVDRLRAPDTPDFDILGDVLPMAKKRNMKTIAWLADQIHEEIEEFEMMKEQDLQGRSLNQVCLRNPHFKGFLQAMVTDCVTSHDLDGLLWRSERWGPLTNTLYKYRGDEHSVIPCFCPYCRTEGVEQGIDLSKVEEGYTQLTGWVSSLRAGETHSKGAYINFWRFLLQFPEILAWEKFWYDGLLNTYRMVYKWAKAIKPNLMVGTAIPHSISFNPFYRALVDFKTLATCNDFLKIIAYHSDGGPRATNYVDQLYNTYLADLSQQERLDFMYHIMGFHEGTYDHIEANGLSPDYVYRESKAWLHAARGTDLNIWPGIDIDVSPKSTDPARSRAQVRDAVLAAFKAGSTGVVLARMYAEMMLDHLAGAGDAIRDLGLCK